MTKYDELRISIEKKKAKVCVIGMGYIGLPTALFYARAGLDVQGIDTNEDLVTELGEGKIRMKEEGLDELADEYLDSIYVTASYESICDSDIYVLCLPSPINQENRAVLKYLQDAVKQLGQQVCKRCLILVESTVPVGATEKLATLFAEESDMILDEDFWVVHCPERVLPGKVVKEMDTNHRLAGGVTENSTKLGEAFLETVFDSELVHPTTAAVSETAKLAENAYRDVQIGFVNELAKFCTDMSIDVTEVIRLANLHPRVSMLKPGLGVGGYCLPKDGWILVDSARENDSEAKVIPAAREVNESMPSHVFRRIQKVILEDSTVKRFIGLLGLSFKPNVSDTRNSPSVDLLRLLTSAGDTVIVYDPYVDRDFGVQKADSLEDVIEQCEIIVLAVPHDTLVENLEDQNLEDIILVDPWNKVPHLQGKVERYLGLTV
ncbi:MAG: nucleotide sugar dehydrogenase [Candidatus Lokiarchaeota archaeon]|nr:nucleotide sugar dehydrogenase [Candidatus Lokiarchaeota archaeon]